MERGGVDDVAEHLRHRYAAQLDKWSHDGEGRGEGCTRGKEACHFAPISSRKRQSNAASTPEIDWHSLIRTIFRRFAGRIVVQGKLLNKQELEVHRFCQVGQEPSVIIPPHMARLVVACDDGPSSEIGATCSAITVPTKARVAMNQSEDRFGILVRVQSGSETWSNEKTEVAIDGMTSVFGFDVNSFRADRHRYRPTDARGDADGDEIDDSIEDAGVNAFISNHRTTSELRNVEEMMTVLGLQPKSWTSLVKPLVDTSSDWSYASLGLKQKKVWSGDRLLRGDMLRAKDRLKEALVEYTSAIDLDDANTDALCKRGEVHLSLRRFEDAIRDFETVIQREPTCEAAVRGLLKAKGRRGHSERIVVHRNTSRSKSPQRNGAVEDHPVKGVNQTQELRDVDATLVTLEKERLKRLLEEEERNRRRNKHQSSDDDSDTGTDSDDDHHRRKRKKSSRKKKSKKSSKKSKSSRERKSSRRSDSVRRSRSRSRSQSRSTGDRDRDDPRKRHRSRSRSRSRSKRSSRGDRRSTSPSQRVSITA